MTFEGLYLGNPRRYRLLRVLILGGLNDVYLANDLQRPRQVAIQIIPINTALSSREIQRTFDAFQREIRTVTSLNHPAQLSILDTGKQRLQGEWVAYIVMPYCPGGTLEGWLARSNQTKIVHPRYVAHFVSQAASSLQRAHSRGVIHGDIRPANFLIRNEDATPSRVRRPLQAQFPELLLTGFGTIKLASITTTSNRPSSSMYYMAPERWQGQTVPSSDQYALAVMAYELLTGVKPFTGAKYEVSRQHLFQSPGPPSKRNPTLSRHIDEVLLKALAKSPHRRYSSIADFATAFEKAVDQSEETRPDSMTVPLTPYARIAPRQHRPQLVAPAPKQQRPVMSWKAGVIFIVTIICLIMTTAVAYPLFAAHNVPPVDPTPTTQPSSLVLTDQLKDNSHGLGWEEDTDASGGCLFQSGAYHAIQQQTKYFTTCTAKNTDFRDFSYQADITLLQGNAGGLIFREQDNAGGFYAFLIARDGSFTLLLYLDNTRATARQLAHRTSSAIHTQLNDPNLLDVSAHGNRFDLAVNGQQVVQVHDTSNQFTHGRIGVIADAGTLAPSEVAISNIKVWTL
jgi:serine/threonine protein kinase